MKKIKWVLLILIILTVGAFFAVTHITYYNGHFYRKDVPTLDLREEALTVSDFEALSAKLPGRRILWNIPFQGGSIGSDATYLEVSSLTDGDVALLDYATDLETVDGTGCEDFPQLITLQQRRPNVKVLYQVTISGAEWDQDTEEMDLTGLSEADATLLQYLPKLSSVNISGCQDYSLLLRLQEENPQWDLRYTVALGDEEFPWDAETIQVQNIVCEQLDQALVGLPKLKQLDLTNPLGDGQILTALRDNYPNVDIHWQVELCGQTFQDDVTEVDISGAQVESCEAVEQAVACLPNLEKLIMDNCLIGDSAIENEDMAAFRERQRDNYKVVWTITLTTREALKDKRYIRSDTTKLWSNCYYYDSELVNLKYCEDMIALDLGHTGVMNVDFVANMPHLTYLILAHTPMRDISPLSSCKELKFLELDWSLVTDYSPLLGCTSLEDLNLGLLYGDAEPVAKMTWLKHLWWKDCKYQKQQLLIEALPDTVLMFSMEHTVDNGWRKLQNYYDMRDALDAYYM